jgi:hypothetical protein
MLDCFKNIFGISKLNEQVVISLICKELYVLTDNWIKILGNTVLTKSQYVSSVKIMESPVYSGSLQIEMSQSSLIRSCTHYCLNSGKRFVIVMPVPSLKIWKTDLTLIGLIDIKNPINSNILINHQATNDYHYKYCLETPKPYPQSIMLVSLPKLGFVNISHYDTLIVDDCSNKIRIAGELMGIIENLQENGKKTLILGKK